MAHFHGYGIGGSILRLGCAEKSFQHYMRRRLRTVQSHHDPPGNTHGIDAGVDVEQGQDEDDDGNDDDDLFACNMFEKRPAISTLVTPHAGIGPITTMSAERCQPGERVSVSMLQ